MNRQYMLKLHEEIVIKVESIHTIHTQGNPKSFTDYRL